MKSLSICFAVGVAMLALAGCRSTPNPSTADLMRTHAFESQAQADLKNQLAKNWERGSKLVQSGEKHIKDGEKRIKDSEKEIRSAERDLKKGRSQVDEGNREIDEGRKLMQESRRRFRENFPGLELNW